MTEREIRAILTRAVDETVYNTLRTLSVDGMEPMCMNIGAGSVSIIYEGLGYRFTFSLEMTKMGRYGG